MATVKELTVQVDELQASLDHEQEQIKAAIDKLQATIDELTANISSGGTVEERQALADKLTGIKTDLEATQPDAEPEPEV